DLQETRELLADCAHILRRIGQSLIARGSSYAAVLQAVLVISREGPIDVAAVPRIAERNRNLHRDWFEQPHFGGESLGTMINAEGLSAPVPVPDNTAPSR